MRSEQLYLSDIAEAADAIQLFLKDTNEAAFMRNDLVRSAVLQKLTIIGEATSRLSTELKDKHPDIPWRKIIAFRNFAVHAYFAVDWTIVWVAATKDAPELRGKIAPLLEQRLGDAGGC